MTDALNCLLPSFKLYSEEISISVSPTTNQYKRYFLIVCSWNVFIVLVVYLIFSQRSQEWHSSVLRAGDHMVVSLTGAVTLSSASLYQACTSQLSEMIATGYYLCHSTQQTIRWTQTSSLAWFLHMLVTILVTMTLTPNDFQFFNLPLSVFNLWWWQQLPRDCLSSFSSCFVTFK